MPAAAPSIYGNDRSELCAKDNAARDKHRGLKHIVRTRGRIAKKHAGSYKDHDRGSGGLPSP